MSLLRLVSFRQTHFRRDPGRDRRKKCAQLQNVSPEVAPLIGGDDLLSIVNNDIPTRQFTRLLHSVRIRVRGRPSEFVKYFCCRREQRRRPMQFQWFLFRISYTGDLAD